MNSPQDTTAPTRSAVPSAGGDEAIPLQELYSARFDDEAASRDALWKVLCQDFFQAFVPEDGVVVDIAAGHCEFINNIRARRRIAVDLNPDVVQRAAPDVEAMVCASDRLDALAAGSVDRVFISNFFEHVPREVILSTLREARRILRTGGQLLLLQPNVRYCGRDYWQFFDHITPVDDRAMVEAFAMSGFEVARNTPRFLPYTTKSRLPVRPFLVRLYVRSPLLWRLFGAQAFMIAIPR